MNGTLYAVGVGPGDPDQLTLKAVKILEKSEVIGYKFILQPSFNKTKLTSKSRLW